MATRKRAWPLVLGSIVIVTALLLPAALSVEEGTAARAASSVGVPHVGDAGRYSLSFSSAGYSMDGALLFRWTNATREKDAFGIDGPVDRAEVWLTFDGPSRGASTAASSPTLPMTLGFKPGAISPSTVRTSEFGASLSQGPASAKSAPSDPNAGYTLEFDPTTPDPFTCFLRSAVQGAAYDALSIHPLGDFCPGEWGASMDARVVSTHESVAGYDATHVRLEGAPSGGPAETADLWYGGGLPYPIRASFTQGGATVDLTLTNASLGNAALLAGPVPPAPARRPDGEFLPPSDSAAGPAEGRVGSLPFALSDAIAHVKSDPRGKAAQDFLSAHPDARLALAELSPLDAPKSGWSWAVSWATPSGDLQPAEVDRLDGVSAGGLPAVGLPQSQYDVSTGHAASNARFDLGSVPTQLLTLGDGAKLFADAFGGAAPDHVDFALLPRPTLTLHDAGHSLSLDAATGAARQRSSHATRTTAGAVPLVGAALVGDARRAASVPFLPGVPPEAARAGGVSVASATAIALLAYYFGAHLVAMLARVAALPLFTRLPRGEALANPTRRRVYDAIEADPGIHTNLLRERTGCGNGALLYHLEVLTRERLVARVELGRFTRYFVSGSYTPGEMRTRALLLAGSGQRLFDLVREHPGIRLKELAELAGLSVPSAHRALARLEAAGLVARERVGRDVKLVARESERAMS